MGVAIALLWKLAKSSGSTNMVIMHTSWTLTEMTPHPLLIIIHNHKLCEITQAFTCFNAFPTDLLSSVKVIGIDLN